MCKDYLDNNMKPFYFTIYKNSIVNFIIIFLLCFLTKINGFNETNSTSDSTNLDVFHNDSNIRESRFFPFFSIIRFPNSACPGPSTFDGTCFTRRECNDIGGSYSGTCANRRGVCCVVQMSCGATTNVNNTYFTNQGFPSTFPGGGRCSIFVRRCNTGVCQLRLDLLEFTLGQPNGDGVCVTDALTISGGSAVPRLCGDNSGQHLYVNFNGDSLLTISIDASSAFSFNRRWNIKLTQIACDCPTRAPSGCLQYHTESSGTVNSFNYGTAANTALSTAGLTGTRQLVNMNYGVCIRREAGFCSIQWSPTGDPFAFTLIGDVDTGGFADTVCETDYLIIPQNSGTSDRICGIDPFTSVTTPSQPFNLYVVTNNNEGTDSGNRGFSLSYAQQACTP